MDRNYAFKIEDEDYELLESFNDVLKLEQMGRCPRNYHTDASGITSDGKEINIELKRRNQTLSGLTIMGVTSANKPYTASTIYIETHKCGDMLLDYVCENKVPMYINFLNDGYVIVHNLSQLKTRPAKVGKKIYSKLYEGFEISKRNELQLDDAWIYKKDENNKYQLVYKP